MNISNMIFVNSIDMAIKVIKYLYLTFFKYIKIPNKFYMIIYIFFAIIFVKSKQNFQRIFAKEKFKY